jgi:hypothetical protein
MQSIMLRKMMETFITLASIRHLRLENLIHGEKKDAKLSCTDIKLFKDTCYRGHDTISRNTAM